MNLLIQGDKLNANDGPLPRNGVMRRPKEEETGLSKSAGSASNKSSNSSLAEDYVMIQLVSRSLIEVLTNTELLVSNSLNDCRKHHLLDLMPILSWTDSTEHARGHLVCPCCKRKQMYRILSTALLNNWLTSKPMQKTLMILSTPSKSPTTADFCDSWCTIYSNAFYSQEENLVSILFICLLNTMHGHSFQK